MTFGKNDHGEIWWYGWKQGISVGCVHRKGLRRAKSRCLHKAWSQHNDHIDHHTMITLFTPKWRLWSQLQAYQLDRHIPQSIWSRLQPNYQMTTSWWSTCCPHRPSLACASKSNLGWPHLSLSATPPPILIPLHLATMPLLPRYMHCIEWSMIGQPIEQPLFSAIEICVFFLHILTMQGYPCKSFSDLSQKHAMHTALLVRVLIASFSFFSPNQTMKARHKNAGIWPVGAMLWGWVLHFVYFAFCRQIAS